MALEYKVMEVQGSEPWQSKNGPMTQFTLGLKRRDGELLIAQINSKPPNVYSVGQIFWADIVGDYRGMPKLKRANAPDGAPNGGGQRSQPASGGQGQRASGSAKVPYAHACALLQRISQDFPEYPAHATTLYLAVMDGRIEEPSILPESGDPQPGNVGSFDDDDPPPF